MFIDFNSSETAVEEYYLDEDKLLKGNPKQSVWNHFTNHDKSFYSGVWQSEVGKWSIQYTEDEFCQIVSGISVITDEKGNEKTVKAGDNFILKSGFRGTWEVLETTKKIYVIYEREG